MYNKNKATITHKLYKVKIEGEDIPYIVEFESLAGFLETILGLEYSVAPYALYVTGEEPC